MSVIAVCLRSRLLSEAVALLLTSEQGVEAVATDPLELASKAAEDQTAGVLIDGDAARAVKSEPPVGRPMVVLGRREQDANGVADVVTGLAIDVDVTELAEALRRLARGDVEPMRRAARSNDRGRRSTDGHGWLTAREQEVLELLAAASTSAEIAVALEVSEHTVRTHVQNLLAKLDASSKVDAVARARTLGLLEKPRSR